MHIILVASLMALGFSTAVAQQTTQETVASEYSTGRTIVPNDEAAQSQDYTGSGGAPASSPQGETPPENQAAPEGSSKTIVEADK